MEGLNTEDGQLFIKSLASFVRTHEKSLANSLQMQRQRAKTASTASLTGLNSPTTPTIHSSTSSSLMTAFSFGGLNFMSHNIKPAQLTLTPHHLFYILSRLEELDIPVGPMTVRLESIHTETSPGNYVSFLTQPPRKRSDRDSIHSVSSMRSVMSGMSSLWSGMGRGNSGGHKSEKAKAALEADMKYLYSAFTKLPSLRLAPDHRARLIRGYEEFPFDTAVPLFAFKNIQSLDIVDMDFRQFYGWDRLADQLSLLTVKRAKVDDPRDLITHIVLDDADKRRHRSNKAQSSPTLAWAIPSSPSRSAVGRSNSDPGSPGGLLDESPSTAVEDADYRDKPGSLPRADGGESPARPPASRRNSSYRHVRSYSYKVKRSGSGSSNSNSSEVSLVNPRNESVSGFPGYAVLSPHKWRFLKYLSLADNSLKSLPTGCLLPLANTLRSLNLSSNLFTEVPEELSGLTRLTSLDLSNCLIQTLHSLGKNPLPAVTTLKLRRNRLSSLVGIERLLSLENLNVQENKISDPMEAARLTGLPNFQRVCVKHNPLVKRPNYRVVIFNLFRGTAGYSDDIVIDETGPGYAERKFLIERAPERERPPVVRPVEIFQLSEPPKPRKENDTESASPKATEEKPYAEHVVNSARRRKAPRRRFVELSGDGEAASGLTSLDPSAFGPALVNSHNQPPSGNPTSPMTANERDLLAGPLSPFSLAERDDFRHRIEALKLEVGDRWLTALKDQGWDGSAELIAQHDTTDRPISSLQRHPSQVLVSGGRTLG